LKRKKLTALSSHPTSLKRKFGNRERQIPSIVITFK
jgi:hypothetical protein